MSRPFRLQVRFWGVRGSTPTPQQEMLGFGGNTPCLECRLPDGQMFIFDAGTGLRNLGAELVRAGDPLSLNVFLTHFHWDHLQGLPFFAPLYSAATQIAFHAAAPPERLRRILDAQMQPPYFAVEFGAVPARCHFVQVDRTPIECGGLTVRPFPLNHPQGATGYRLEANGAAIVYATDLEHGHPTLDGVLRESCAGADILIYDAQYTLEEYERHRGWGHSTWLEATRVAKETHVNQLVLFHHEPTHTDAAIEDMVVESRRRFDNTCAAREGLVLSA